MRHMITQLMRRPLMTILVVIMAFGTTYATSMPDVTLTVSSDGATKDEAIKNALRLAVEQTYGVFISSNTDILNDEIIKDEIITISSGNIKDFKEISLFKLPNGTVSVTLKVTLSIGKLVSYAKSKGAECDFDGQALLADIALKKLYKKNEETAVENMIKEALLNLGDGFDYTIDLGKLRFNDDERQWDRDRGMDIPAGPFEIESRGENYIIPFKITAYLNNNGEQILNNFIATMKILGKDIPDNEKCELNILHPGGTRQGFDYFPRDDYYFRSPKSVRLLSNFFTNGINSIIDSFVIKAGDSFEIDDENKYNWYEGNYAHSEGVKFFGIHDYYQTWNCPKFKSGKEFFFYVGKLRLTEEDLKSIRKFRVVNKRNPEKIEAALRDRPFKRIK